MLCCINARKEVTLPYIYPEREPKNLDGKTGAMGQTSTRIRETGRNTTSSLSSAEHSISRWNLSNNGTIWLTRKMAGKHCHPFIYPRLFIQWIACIHSIFQMPYRQMEGFTTSLSKMLPGLQPADYTTLFRRIQLIPLALPETNQRNGDIVIDVDSTVIKVTNRGEWMREMWRIHRGWIKAHIIVYVKSKELLGIEITNEQIGDGEVFPILLDQAQSAVRTGQISGVLADGAYDQKDIFNRLERDRIDSRITIRENASSKYGGSPYRAESAREKNKLGYRAWADNKNYGKRWAVEGVFSTVKRTLKRPSHFN